MTADNHSGDAGSRTEFAEHEATEAGLSLLARKLRAEMTLALLEDFAAGRRTGRSMLADFVRIQEQFRADLPDDDRQLAQHDATHAFSGTVQSTKHADTLMPGEPGAPEWERLRQQARGRDRPIALWEVFHGLDQLAEQHRNGTLPDRDITVVDVENAMDLGKSVGESWSLHAEVREARAKLGDQLTPSDPVALAGMLQRVDAARTLLKEGHFQVGIRPTPRAEFTAQTMSEAMMRRMEAQIDPATIRAMTEQAAVGLVERGARTPQQRTDLERAMRAGETRALAERAQEVARSARTRAGELRSGQLSARSTLLWAATAGSGVAITGASLAGQTSLALQTTIGLSLTALGATANLLKDWRNNSETLWAPYKAFGAEKFATMATRLADRDRHDLDRNTPVSLLRRARDASRSVQLGLTRRAVERLDRAHIGAARADTSIRTGLEQPGAGQGQSP